MGMEFDRCCWFWIINMFRSRNLIDLHSLHENETTIYDDKCQSKVKCSPKEIQSNFQSNL